MTFQSETVLQILGIISQLPAKEKESCENLAATIRLHVKSAGPSVGAIAVALVGAEMQEMVDRAGGVS